MDKDSIHILNAETGELDGSYQVVPDHIIKDKAYQILMEVANNDDLYRSFKEMLDWHFVEHTGKQLDRMSWIVDKVETDCRFCHILVNW